MQELYRVAHYLAFHDHFEVGGALLQLKSCGRKIPPSLKLRISFYNLRKLCERTTVLYDTSFEKFYEMFEKLELLCDGVSDDVYTWCEMTRLFFVQRSISIMFITLGISLNQRHEEVWVFNKLKPIESADAIAYVQDINNMYEDTISKHPIAFGYEDSYSETLHSVTTALFGKGKISKLMKLSKTKLTTLVNETGNLAQFTTVLLGFLRAVETQVLPVPASIEIVDKLLEIEGEDDLPEYTAFVCDKSI